jgi:hypothetical protein
MSRLKRRHSDGGHCFLSGAAQWFHGRSRRGVFIAGPQGDDFDDTDLPILGGGVFESQCFGLGPIANFGVVPQSVKAKWGSDWRRHPI